MWRSEQNIDMKIIKSYRVQSYPILNLMCLLTMCLGRSRPAGSQCFAGFIPENVVDANRSSVAGYVDLEFDLSDAILLGAAIRAEDYSDFGSNTLIIKSRGRANVSDNFVVRAAHTYWFSCSFIASNFLIVKHLHYLH